MNFFLQENHISSEPKLFLFNQLETSLLHEQQHLMSEFCCYNVKSITKIPLHNIWVLTFDCEGFQIELNYKVNGKLSLKRETALAWYSLLHAPTSTFYKPLLTTTTCFSRPLNPSLWLRIFVEMLMNFYDPAILDIMVNIVNRLFVLLQHKMKYKLSCPGLYCALLLCTINKFHEKGK